MMLALSRLSRDRYLASEEASVSRKLHSPPRAHPIYLNFAHQFVLGYNPLWRGNLADAAEHIRASPRDRG